MGKNRKEQGIGDAVGNVGFAFEMLKAIAHAVMARGGTMQHLRRVVKEATLQGQIAELIVPAEAEIGRPLREEEYLVHVGYDMPRNDAKLEAEFSKGKVYSGIYEHKWKPCDSAKDDQLPGNRLMRLMKLPRDPMYSGSFVWQDDFTQEMHELDYRPATIEELYAFSKANPEVQCSCWIVALGSRDGCSNHPMLCNDIGGRAFSSTSALQTSWGENHRLLFVRYGLAGPAK